METLYSVTWIFYLALAVFVLPPFTVRSDIFKPHIRLMPYWFKYVSFLWLCFIILFSFIVNSQTEAVQIESLLFTNNFLSMGINLSLLVIATSKDKIEDEYSNQIRLRSMYLSAIWLFIFSGVFISVVRGSTNSTRATALDFWLIVLNGTLLVYLTNYYLSKYYFNK